MTEIANKRRHSIAQIPLKVPSLFRYLIVLCRKRQLHKSNRHNPATTTAGGWRAARSLNHPTRYCIQPGQQVGMQHVKNFLLYKTVKTVFLHSMYLYRLKILRIGSFLRASRTCYPGSIGKYLRYDYKILNKHFYTKSLSRVSLPHRYLQLLRFLR